MSGISTHVLDLTKGQPAAGIGVKLERLVFGSWTEVASRQTDGDGRADEILRADEVTPGSYRLLFDTVTHLPTSLYPEVIISFLVTAGETKYHLPLLLSAHGYTTYRGS